MAIPVSDRAPQLNSATPTAVDESPRLTVTGLDEMGQMFRETASILSLDGRDCSFQSKFHPALGSWVLVELDLSKDHPKTSGVQAQVKSVQTGVASSNVYRIWVELEAAQALKIGSGHRPPKVASPGPQPFPGSSSRPDPAAATKIISMSPAAAAKTASSAQVPVSAEVQPSKPFIPAGQGIPFSANSVVDAEVDGETLKSAISLGVKEQWAAVKDSLRKELEQTVLRNVSSGVEQTIRQSIEKQISTTYQSTIQTLNSDLTHQVIARLAGSEQLRASIEAMAKKALEEQVQASRNSAIEAQQNLDARAAEWTRSVAAAFGELENRTNAARDSETQAHEKTLAAKQALEQRIQASRNLVIEAQQSLDSRAAELARSIQAAFGELENRTTAAHDSETAAHEMALAAKRSLEDQIQASRDFIIESRQNLNLQRVELAQTAEAAFRELENRTNIARDSETAAQQRTQALEKEIAEATFRLQKAVEQVNHTAQSTVGKFDNHITAQLNSWSAQFKSHLDAVSRDKSTQFAAEIEQQLTSHRQQMNETLEKLSAGLHLAQGTARMQEERLAELSRDTAASFEAEIRRVLLRLAGPV